VHSFDLLGMHFGWMNKIKGWDAFFSTSINYNGANYLIYS